MKPLYHPDGVGRHADGTRNKECNRARNWKGAVCHKRACLRHGYNEIDKLKTSLRLHTRTLHGDDGAGPAGVDPLALLLSFQPGLGNQSDSD